MPKIWGDESGLVWDTPVKVKIKVGKTAAQKANSNKPTPGVMVVSSPRLRRPPPENYQVPTEFPRFSEGKIISLDFETHDPDIHSKGPGSKRDGYIVGVGIRTGDWEGDYYPIRHDYGPNCNPNKVLGWLRDEFKAAPPGTILTGCNPLYEGEYAKANGIDLSHLKFRPVDFAEPLLDENLHRYSLENISQRWLGHGKVDTELKQLYGDNFKEHFRDIHPGHAQAYGLGDIDQPLEILPLQEAQLEKEGLTNLYDLECRLIPMLIYMRDYGVAVDVPAAENFGGVLNEHITEQQSIIKNLCGFEVNPNAAAQIARAFDKVGLPYGCTEKGNPSFTGERLENYSHPLAETVLAARTFEKFKGTFVESYVLNAHQNGRLYTMFHPLKGDDGGTVTGRFSSSHPNLQNIPIRDKVMGPLCRSLFIPDQGCSWWSLDYSQIEYRFLVHFAYLAKCMGASSARAAYLDNPQMDYHQLVAELTGTDRNTVAKHLNFGLVYGMGIDLLALKLGLVDGKGRALPEAIAIMDKYHGAAPFIKQIINLASSRASEIGFVRTVLNRKRRFNLFEPQGYWKEENGKWVRTKERQSIRNRPPAMEYDAARHYYETDNLKRAFTHKALNAVLQGSAADLIKLAMVLAWEAGCFGPGKPLQCQLTVHDELDGSKEDSPAGDEALREVQYIMETALQLMVPVMVSGATGRNWAEAK